MTTVRLSCGRCQRPILRDGERYIETCFCSHLNKRLYGIGAQRYGWEPPTTSETIAAYAAGLA